MRNFLLTIVFGFIVNEPLDVFSLGASDAEILEKSRNKYTSLYTYSDDGKYFQNAFGSSRTTIFTTKMSRPGLYRIQWENLDSNLKGAAWNAGKGDFLTQDSITTTNIDDYFKGMGKSRETVENLSREFLFLGGQIITSIPEIFFFTSATDSPISGSSPREARLPDADIGGIDCYVFMRNLKDFNEKVFLGKNDFLIRQIVLEKPEIETAEGASSENIVSIENFWNIITNKKLKPEDFSKNE